MSVTYLVHFGLRQAPFGITPNPALFYNSRGHQRVLDWIEDGIVARAPILSLTGAAGTGKTTLLRLLLDRHSSEWIIGLVSAVPSRPDNILVQARHAFGLPDQGDSSALSSDQIRRFAEVTRANGGLIVLMVDDAQTLEAESLSALASLTTNSAQGSALTLLLAGRPELSSLLDAPELRSLEIPQGAHAVLAPLGSDDTADYVEHRLTQSGAHAPIFDAGALQMLHFFSLGVPRLINIMADHCLMTAAAEGVSQLDATRVWAMLDEATTTGVLSNLAGQAAAGPPQPATQTAPEMPECQVSGTPQHSTASGTADTVDPVAPPTLTVPDPALMPAAAQGTPSSAEPRKEPEARHAAQIGRERRDPPAPGPDALRTLAGPDAAPPIAAAPAHAPYPPADPASRSPRRESGQRSGSWLAAAAVVLAFGAAFVWFQPGQAPAPIATDQAPPAAGAAMEQAAVAPAPAPGQPALSPPAPQSAAPVPEPVAVTPDPTVAALMRRALEIEAQDPAQAAVAYARAALRGRARAAWYLGQFHETGLGVEPSPGMARLWYAAAAGLPAAQRRLQALSAADAPPGTPAAPVPIFQARLAAGGSEMIWRVPEGVTPVRFRVEILGSAGEPLPVRETTVPGLIVPVPVSAWRVTAIGADGTESAPSAMVRMIPAKD